MTNMRRGGQSQACDAGGTLPGQTHKINLSYRPGGNDSRYLRICQRTYVRVRNVAEDKKDGEDYDRYRRFAQSCLKFAQRANDQATRAMFLAMAQTWNSLADRNLTATTQTALEDFNQRQLEG